MEGPLYGDPGMTDGCDACGLALSPYGGVPDTIGAGSVEATAYLSLVLLTSYSVCGQGGTATL